MVNYYVWQDLDLSPDKTSHEPTPVHSAVFFIAGQMIFNCALSLLMTDR
jgi:hypothetical protein